MTKLWGFVFVAVAACGGSSPPPAPPPSNTAPPPAVATPPAAQPEQYPDDAVAAIARFRDEACACKTSACEQALVDRVSKWGADHAGKDPGTLPNAQMKLLTDESQQMGDCIGKMMSAGSGTP